MVLSNSQMKLTGHINQTGRQLSHSRWIFFSEVYVSHTSFALIVKVLYTFLSLLQITNYVFLTYLQMWLPESDVRRIIREMLSFHGKTEKNCCLVDTAFSTGCDEKSFVSIFGESAAEPPQPLPAAARAAAVHRGCFFREEGWLTAPCIAHHHTRTVRR